MNNKLFRITYNGVVFLILWFLLFLTNPSSLLALGVPHLIYGKVFNSDNTIPPDQQTLIYAYIPSRSNETLNNSVAGCGYNITAGVEGWMRFETANLTTPWSAGEDVRVIVCNCSLQETGAIDFKLNSAGKQLLPDLILQAGDNVGPIALESLANGETSLSIPAGTGGINVTAAIDDHFSGESNIQAAEYFIDTDPGTGAGMSMTAYDGAFDSYSENVHAWISTSSWSQGSIRTIYIRGLDIFDNWGPPHLVVISVGPPLP